MRSSSHNQRCERRNLVALFALGALARDDADMMRAHLPTCAECQREFHALSTVTDTLSAWRAQPLPQSTPSLDRLIEQLS